MNALPHYLFRAVYRLTRLLVLLVLVLVGLFVALAFIGSLARTQSHSASSMRVDPVAASTSVGSPTSDAIAATDELSSLQQRARASDDLDEIVDIGTAQLNQMEKLADAVGAQAARSRGEPRRILFAFEQIVRDRLARIRSFEAASERFADAGPFDYERHLDAAHLANAVDAARTYATEARDLHEMQAGSIARMQAELGTAHPQAVALIESAQQEFARTGEGLVALFGAHATFAAAVDEELSMLQAHQGRWQVVDGFVAFDDALAPAYAARDEAAFAANQELQQRVLEALPGLDPSVFE